MARIAVSLGGYVAEEQVFGDITTGPSNDLQVSTSLARAMVTRWGMSDTIGPIALESDGGRTLFGTGVNDKDYSEKMSSVIDEEVKKIMDGAFEITRKTLRENRKTLDAIARALIEKETLEQEEYEKVLILEGVDPKKGKETIQKDTIDITE